MSIDNFKPRLWAAGLNVPFEENLVYADPLIASTEFQPMLAGGGLSVEINKIGAGTTRKYVKGEALTYDEINTEKSTLTMDQQEYYGFVVNDIDKAQAAGEFESTATRQHALAMAGTVDKYLGALLADNAGKKLGNTGVFNGRDFTRPKTGQMTAWDMLNEIVLELNKVSAPSTDRWLVAGPKFASALLRDSHLTEADKAGTDQVARTGQVAAIKTLGITVKTSNNVPVVAGREKLVAGVPGALEFATQLRTVEVLRDKDDFQDYFRGLQVYGGVVAAPEGLVCAEADVLDGTPIYTDAAA